MADGLDDADCPEQRASILKQRNAQTSQKDCLVSVPFWPWLPETRKYPFQTTNLNRCLALQGTEAAMGSNAQLAVSASLHS